MCVDMFTVHIISCRFKNMTQAMESTRHYQAIFVSTDMVSAPHCQCLKEQYISVLKSNTWHDKNIKK